MGVWGRFRDCRDSVMARIFISYRRDDAGGYSLLLFDRLAQHFGRGRVFMDIDTIEPGVDFVHVIQNAVGACDAVIALIGKHWLTIVDDYGRRRIELDDDFVRLEIAAALEKNIRVIPVLVRGAQMPVAEDLPAPIRGLARRQAFELSDERIHYDLERLIEVLEKTARGKGSPVTDSWLDRLERFETREYILRGEQPPKPAPVGPRPTRLLFEPETVIIPAGPFLSGDDLESVSLPQFAIGKYPVRVIEYRAFVTSGGYDHPDFWTETGWEWKTRNQRTQPDHWDEDLWVKNEWLPVVGVTWYEAYAYCQWLARKTGWPYRLPTTLEWEKAARGTDGRLYPWGNDRRQGACNIYSERLGHTSQTGAYSPQGDSPYKVADMIGNVSEWTQTKWPNQSGRLDNSSEGREPRIQHGGSWSSVSLVRASSRLRCLPTESTNYVGFRVARSNVEE